MQIDAKLRFDNFIVGSANRLAVAAAQAVADLPGSVYNPLFMYSSSGLGKTHLMSAIGNLVLQRKGHVVALVTLDDFVEELHAAIAAGETEKFKQKYLRVGTLLIDDMQFLTGHRETQNELLRIFNAMTADNRQIVMTSDRPPAEIADVDERLLTRLAGGLIVDMGAPDYETRMAILNAKCDERGVRFRAGVIDEVGRIEFTNVRELQGALNRLIAHQTLGSGQINAEDVPGILGDLAEQHARVPRRRESGEFARFLSDITEVVSEQVDHWRTPLSDGIAYWRGEGYRTGLLDRTLNDPGTSAPNVERLLRDFEAAVARLRDIEKQVTHIDASLGEHEALRDPDRLPEAEQLLERAIRSAAPPPGPSAAFTRAGFEVSASNQLAVRAADAIVSAPGSRYNPLFVHGPSGVGKTHLLNAIGNGLVDALSDGVACVPAPLFVDELIAALQEGTVDRWRARYRAATALLLDDVQFVAGKERTQEELFHVFNALYAEGKQLVIASDRPPRELTGLEERLRSRFEGGLVVEMQSPDRALRERLYARFLRDLGVEPTADMLAYLSDRPVSSVREIIGTANGILASAEVAAVPVTLGFIRAQLDPDNQDLGHAAAMHAAADTFFLDREKVIWHWPDPVVRLIEDLR
jgi:chromosomal replication initiation ATPase DnaA